MIVTLMLWFPFTIVQAIRQFTIHLVDSTLFFILPLSLIIAYSNSIANAIIFLTNNTKAKQYLKSLIRKREESNENNVRETTNIRP